MSYVHFLRKNNASWRPAYVRDEKNFLSKITSYRAKWSRASNANQAGIEANFKRNYNRWLTKVKAENVERRKKNQELFNQIRQAKKAGNNASVARLLKSPNKLPNASPKRLSPPVRSGGKRNTKSLVKKIASRRLDETKRNLRAQLNALEAQRNNIERKINAVRREFRSLPVPP